MAKFLSGRDFLKWLTPGMHIKRWIALLMLAVAIMGLGIAYVLREAYVTYTFPAWVAVLTLQDIPRLWRGVMFMGTAIALTLVRGGHDVRLWSVDEAYARVMSESRQNPKFLPGIELPAHLTIGSSAQELARGVDAIFSVIPTQYLRTS